MTFVAQPYERFVDDLLIALTGGTIREEHEFTGLDRAYSLGSPDVVPESLQVFGQRDAAFAVFEQGIDYRYDAVEDTLAWLLDGRPPDDHTQFYVSYYGTQGPGRLTDRNPGSVTTTLAEAFARQYGVLHKEMELIYESAFVDTATDSSLDHVAALLDVVRKDAKFATGEVIFKRTTPAPGDIAIAVGTLVSTPEGQSFETTAPRTLRRDQLSATVPIRAQLEGPAGSVAAGAITVVNRPIFGIDAVQNERPTFFASERETDEELRRRIRGRLHRAGRSTLDAIRTSLIDEVPSLTEANVQVSEKAETPGYVDVRLGVAEGADAQFVAAVDAAILGSRAAGVRVRHNLGGPAAPAAAADGAGIPREQVVADQISAGVPADAVQLAGGADGAATVPLRVEVLMRLADANMTVSEREGVETKVRDAVADYVGGLAMGAPLVHAKLLGRVVAPDEVADASLVVTPLAGDRAGQHLAENVVAEGRKATVDPHEVAVYLMDQRVSVDLHVRVEGDGDTDAARSVVSAAAEAALASPVVSRQVITQAVGAALGDPALGLGLVERDPVVVNATYEESGRIVSDADVIELAQHEVAKLGTVAVDRIGALDG